MVKLLVSIKEPNEILDALEGGADIIDVKDTEHGSLGLPSLLIVREAALKIGKLREKSAPLGDVSHYDESLAYAAYVLDELGYNYIKIGLKTNSRGESIKITHSVVSSVSHNVKVVLVGYADFQRFSTLSPLDVIDVASYANANGVMIDTLGKGEYSTFDILSYEYLSSFVNKARKYGLFTALAGGLKISHIDKAVSLGFDVIGVRTAACQGGRNGRVKKDLVMILKQRVLETEKVV